MCSIIRVKSFPSCRSGQNKDICPSIKKSMGSVTVLLYILWYRPFCFLPVFPVKLFHFFIYFIFKTCHFYLFHMFCFLRMFEKHTIGVDFVKCRTTKWFTLDLVYIPTMCNSAHPLGITNHNLRTSIFHLLTQVKCLVLLWAQNDFGPSKSFWSSTNHFGQFHFVLIGSKSFWTGPNYKN